MSRVNPSFTSFAGGEVSSRMYGRIDLQNYFQMCSEVTNTITLPHGPATKRPGFKYINVAGDPTQTTRVIPFIYSTEQAYVLEFGNELMQVYKDDIDGIGGVVQVSGVDYQISTPYTAADVMDLKYAQTADTMYITHNDYPPYKLTREGHSDWTLSKVDFVNGPFLDQNTDETWTLTATAVTGSVTVTSNTDPTFYPTHSGSEWAMYGSKEVSINITAENQWSDAIGADKGDTLIVSVKGTWIATITVQRSFDFGVTWQTFTSFSYNQSFEITEARDDIYYRIGCETGYYTSGTASCSITRLNTFGYFRIDSITSTTEVLATVIKELPTDSATYKWAEGAWSDYQGYPGAVAFFEQRLLFGGSGYRPATIWGSEIDDYENFDKGNALDNNAYTFVLAGNNVNAIKWMQPNRVLYVGTTGGEWKFGLTDSATTPTNVDAKKQTSYGSEGMQAIDIGHHSLFVQRGGNIVRSLLYDYRLDGWVSPEISARAEHILKDGGGAIDSAVVLRPDSMAWWVRWDGDLIGCTYDPYNQISSFHRHETNGNFESVAVIPGEERDELWAVIKRSAYETYNDNTDWYLTPGGLGGVWDSINNRWQSTANIDNDNYSIDITVSGSWNSGYRPTDITITLLGAPRDIYLYDTISGTIVSETSYISDTETDITFASNDISRLTMSTASGTNTVFYITNIRFRIADTRYVEQMQTSEWNDIQDVIYCDSEITYTGTGVSSIAGLGHLEGREVAILTHGAVHPNQVVKKGEIGLQWNTAYAHIGLPYQARVQTLDIEAGGNAGSVQGRSKRVFRTIVRLKDTVGLQVGSTVNDLDELEFRNPSTPMNEAVDPFTGDKEIIMPKGFDKTSKIMVANNYPLPFTLVSIFPTLHSSDK
jgi:hypothetical protein